MSKSKKIAAIIIFCIVVLGGSIIAGLLLGGSDKEESSSNDSVLKVGDNSSDNVSDILNTSNISADDSTTSDKDNNFDTSGNSDDSDSSSASEDEIPEGSTGEYDLVTYNGVEYKLYKMDSDEFEYCWVYDENIPIEAYHLDLPDSDIEMEDYIWNLELCPDYTHKMYEEIADKADAYLKHLCTWDGINHMDRAREFAEELAGLDEDVEKEYNDYLEGFQTLNFDGKLFYDLYFESSTECYINYGYKCLVKSKGLDYQPDCTACVISYGNLYFRRIDGEWQIAKNEANHDIPFGQYYVTRLEDNTVMFYQREPLKE